MELRFLTDLQFFASKKGVGSTQNSKGVDKNPSPYWIVGKKTSGSIRLHNPGAIPKEYRPKQHLTHITHTNDYVYWLENNGAVGVHNNDGVGSTSGDGIEVSFDFSYHY